MIKIRAKLNDMNILKKFKGPMSPGAGLFEKTNKTDKPLNRFIKKRRDRTQISKTRNVRYDVTTHTTEIQRIVRNYYEQIYAKKLDILGEMDKFLETYNLSKLNQEEAENLNRLKTTTET